MFNCLFVLCCISDGTLHDALVTRKLLKDSDLYLVEIMIHGKKSREIELRRDEILQDKSIMRRLIGHQVKGKLPSSQHTEFHVEWESGEREWCKMRDIRNDFASPPSLILDYVRDHDLKEVKDCKWLKKYLIHDNALVEIIAHKKVKGKIKVCCRYDNGDEDWEPIEEIEEGDKDDKLCLGKYVKQNQLSKMQGWGKASSYWLKSVQDLLCNEQRSSEIDSLTKALHKAYTTSFEKFGPNDARYQETVILGRAYKESLEIEKHGGKVKLPLYLKSKFSKRMLKHIDISID